MLSNDLEITGICGNIAVGYVVEQIGIPSYDRNSNIWNETSFDERLFYYLNTYKLPYTVDYVKTRL